MDERDAFGREKGEDPLAEMGWNEGPAGESSVAAVPAGEDAPPPQPVEEAFGDTPVMTAGSPLAESPPAPPASPVVIATPAQWAAQTQASPAPPPAPRRSRGFPTFRVFRLLTFLIVLGVGASIAIPVINDVKDKVESVTIPSFPDLDGGSGGKTPASPPEGFDKQSLLLRGNLAPAVRDLRRAVGGGDLRFLRVDAQSVQVQAVRGSQLVIAQKRWDGKADVITTAPRPPGLTTFPWRRVNLSAPRRLVSAIGRRTGGKPASFGYMVLIDAAGLQWSAFTKSGKGFIATPSGRITQGL